MAQQGMILTDVDEAIILALGRFSYLTAAQVTRLLFPGTNDADRRSQRRLKALVDAGYVLRLRALKTPQYGSAAHVFTLGKKGRQYLASLGFLVSSYYRPSEEREKAFNNPF